MHIEPTHTAMCPEYLESHIRHLRLSALFSISPKKSHNRRIVCLFAFTQRKKKNKKISRKSEIAIVQHKSAERANKKS